MNNLRVYCQDCGCMHSYTLHKPNFCQSCGSAMGSSKPQAQKRESALEEENVNVNFDKINSLDFEAEHYNASPQTLGSIMEASSGQEVKNNQSFNEPPKRSKQEILEELKKESTTLRPNS